MLKILAFFPSSFCTVKFKSSWKCEVLSHLKEVHKRNKSDSTLYRHYLRLPANLMMVCCKISSCYEGVFLGRTPEQLGERLKGTSS